jgi:hypothetical protein
LRFHVKLDHFGNDIANPTALFRPIVAHVLAGR